MWLKIPPSRNRLELSSGWPLQTGLSSWPEYKFPNSLEDSGFIIIVVLAIVYGAHSTILSTFSPSSYTVSFRCPIWGYHLLKIEENFLLPWVLDTYTLGDFWPHSACRDLLESLKLFFSLL